MSPSRVAKAIASSSEAIPRNSASGSRRIARRVPCANSPRVTSTGLRRRARPERTAGLFAGAGVAGAAPLAAGGGAGSRSSGRGRPPRSSRSWLLSGWSSSVIGGCASRSRGQIDRRGQPDRAAPKLRPLRSSGASLTRRAQKCNAVHKNDTSSQPATNPTGVHRGPFTRSSHEDRLPPLCNWRSQKRHIAQTHERQSCASG